MSVDREQPRRPLLPLVAFNGVLGLLLIGWLQAVFWTAMLQPPSAIGLTLAGLLGLGTLALTLRAFQRLIVGPRRLVALLLLLVGWLPTIGLGTLVFLGLRQFHQHDIRFTIPLSTTYAVMLHLVEPALAHGYRHRLESDRLILLCNDDTLDAEEDLAAMDRFVADLETALRRPLRGKIVWVRGPVLGFRALSTPGYALGSEGGRAGDLDRHELTHSTLNQHLAPGVLPPMFVIEGWAEAAANSHLPFREAANLRDWLVRLEAMDERLREQTLPMLMDTEGFRDLLDRRNQQGEAFSYLEAFASEFWYHRDHGAVYPFGHSFMTYLLQRYGAKKVAAFYYALRPGNFAVTVREVFEIEVAELERDFWAAVDREFPPQKGK
jgi:hypothetical protein